jgi:hypothetical protein
MAYPLPAFVSRTLTAQPSPPRQVPFSSVVRAVLGGFDCAIYAGGAAVGIAFGLAIMTHVLRSDKGSADGLTGEFVLALGLLSLLLPVYRIWQVNRALKKGDAQLAEVVEAEVGRARFYGTPWGEAMGTRMNPIAAIGVYRLPTGEMGRYYMQQRWATRLTPGAHIWVLRRNARAALFAPV